MKKYTLINHDTGEQKHYTKAQWNAGALVIYLLGIGSGIIIGTIVALY